MKILTTTVGTFLLLSVGLTAHAGPPSHELLDDLDRWEDGQDRLIDGPKGCWDLTGTAHQEVTFHQPPDFFSAAKHKVFPVDSTVTGRLVDGRWQAALESTKVEGQDPELDLNIQVYPLFGALPDKAGRDVQEFSVSLGEGDPKIGGSIGHSTNILREALDVRSGSAETSFAQWDRETDSVHFKRSVPVSPDDDRPIEVTVRFPASGERADRLDALWPKKLKLGQWPFKVTIRDAQMHLVGHEADGQTFPWAESVSFVAGAIGYTVGYEQRITWTSAVPCSSEGS